MSARRLAATLAAVAVLAGTAGCAKRTIDPESTGSVEVPGTDGSLQKFCDGSTLIYWTPGLTSGSEDDYEFIVYSSEECTGEATPLPRTQDVPQDDD